MNTLTQPPKSTTPPIGKNKKPNKLAWLGQVLVWQVIALLLVELMLSWAGLGEEEMFALDAELGTKHMSNKHITWRSEGFARSYFDANGMREPNLTIAKPQGTYRIAMLGDSMVEGLQVPVEKSFGQILQEDINQSNHNKVQVLNFGTSGYSTAQEYLQLKKQVFKYQPDIVIAFYNSRDIFENWSSPDETITNLRPNALHLPGANLVIDYSPVLAWSRSARGKFMIATAWLRQHSRVWGLATAAQTEWSYASPFYRAFCTFLGNPKRGIKEMTEALKPKAESQPSFNILKFENTDPTHMATANTTIGEHPNPWASALMAKKSKQEQADDKQSSDKQAKDKYDMLNSAAPNKALRSDTKEITGDQTLAPAKPVYSKEAQAGRNNYIGLITRTQASLYAEMLKECTAHKAKLIVIALPSRPTLSPMPCVETEFFHISYPQEIEMISGMLGKLGIPVFDSEKAATTIPKDEVNKLFYSMHLTPAGHEYLARSISPFVHAQMHQAQSSNP
jgi:hypothetical protein